MAITIVVTPAAADANSYGSVEEGDAYHEAHLYGDDWTDASETEKAAALVMATRLLDAMPRAWTGSASTETQALGWPREGMLSRNGYALASGEIPVDLKNAEFEFARQLLTADRTADNAITIQGIASVKAGSVAVTFKDSSAEGVDERLAMRRRDSLEAMVPDAVIVLLVPSWLVDVREEDAEYDGLVSEVL